MLNSPRGLAAATGFLACVAMIAVLGCQRGDARVPQTADVGQTSSSTSPLPVSRSDSTAVRDAIALRVADSVPPRGVADHHWRHVLKLYAQSSDAPLWIGANGLSADAKLLVEAIAKSPDDGLTLLEFPIAAIDSAVALVVTSQAANITPQQVANTDILLSCAFATYGETMLRGRVDPRKVQRAWHIAPRDADIDSVLASAIRASDFGAALSNFRPSLAGYSTLRDALAEYRGIVARGGWPQIPAVATLHIGDSSAAVPLLRKRLAAEGLVPGAQAASEDQHYDSALASAVAVFQTLHGLAVDSAIGPGTRSSLNVTAQRRIDQIVANMERYRWLPHDLGGRYILVNIPSFQLVAFEDGKRALQMRVVVGSEYGGRATPIFSDSMSYVIFNPYWNVPSSITRAEILPKVRSDRSYLARNNYEIVSGDNPVRVIPVSSLSQSALSSANFRYRIRQRPGPGNALGLVKFIFPNDYNVYLHDTPQGQLFNERVRAFSHGCIRVAQPAQLAEFALGPQGWTADDARTALSAGKWRRVDLDRKLPVYIAYFTAFARDGKLTFRPDLYHLDDALVSALGREKATPDAMAAAERLLKWVGQQ
jgi:murein L,D-transpeptidase YcbB/YkuD